MSLGGHHWVTFLLIETGRLRFIDVSPESEVGMGMFSLDTNAPTWSCDIHADVKRSVIAWRTDQLTSLIVNCPGIQSFNETLSQYKSLILPSSHPTSKYVESVATRIVESNGLGHMKGSKGLVGSLMGAWNGDDVASRQGLQEGGKEMEWEVGLIIATIPFIRSQI